MRRLLFPLITAFFVSCAFAERSSIFGVEAYNANFPARDIKTNTLFSPLALEHDCCTLAEAFDSIGRANVAEKLGVMTDFPSVYGPIIESFANADETNRVEFISARAICVKDSSKADKEYRRKIFELNGSSVCSAWPTIGVERWFRAKMDGNMEDYLVPASKITSTGYTLLDVDYIGAEFPDDVKVEDLTADFTKDEMKKTLPFLKISTSLVFRYDDGILSLKIPLKGGADLYIFTTTNEKPLSDVRKVVNGDNFKSIIYNHQPVEGRGAKESSFDLYLPKIDYTSSCDLDKALDFANVAESGFQSLDKALRKRVSRQTARLNISKSKFPKQPEAQELQVNSKRKRMVIDRPFLFFIHMNEFDLIPAIGEFLGEDGAR
ncbi:MAG: hypothetical protein IJQ34_03755 [Kiritimatiellae bacterium]|nr:hypothetical protein [Kiritimatiellia bacterium]